MRISLAFFFLTAAMAGGQELSLIPSLTSEHSLPAVNQYGRTAISAREGYADVTYPGGRKGRVDILVVLDQLSGFYTWYFGPVDDKETRPGRMASGLLKSSFHYITADHMVGFWGYETNVSIRESRKRSNSLSNAVQSALQEIGASLGELDKGPSGQHDQQFVTIPYRDLLGKDFVDPMHSPRGSPVKLVDVAQVHDKWEITVEVATRAKLVLDKNYKVIEVKK